MKKKTKKRIWENCHWCGQEVTPQQAAKMMRKNGLPSMAKLILKVSCLEPN